MPRLNNAFRPAVEGMESRLVPSVNFAPQQTFTVGSDVVAVAVADFNGDGRPDLVTANQGGFTVSVLLDTAGAGSVTATFAPQQTFAVGSNPLAVAVGDFNGDGRPDLAVSNLVGNTVSVLLNTTPAGSGTVTFAVQQTFAVGKNPRGIAVADFNGDGRPDLAVANSDDSGFGTTVSVLLNTTAAGSGTASFAAQQTFTVGYAPFAVVAADFNGDGRPDLAVVNERLNTLSVLLNTTSTGSASASFAAQQTFSIGTDPRSLAVGDFNVDGRPDLVAANFNGNSVSVLLNTTAAGSGTASFNAQQTFAVGIGPGGVAAGDFDVDGRPDLVVADHLSSDVEVLVNTTPVGATTASFATQQSFAVGRGSFAVTSGDFNGDGRPDLVTANAGIATVGNTVSVLLDTTALFTVAVPVVVGQFGSQGVWQYNRFLGTWVQLTGANATQLATDPRGDVAGEFPGFGVWWFGPTTGWRQINGVDATLLAMDPNGDIAAEFPGYGVGEYLPGSGWRSLTGANASLLAMDALGDVAGEFPGFGVWLFRPASGWTQINGTDAALLAVDAVGDVVAEFRGVGVGEYLPSAGWRLLNGVDAGALAVAASGAVVAADFPGHGVGAYPPAGWRLLTGADASLLGADALGSVYGEFPGHGVWEYDLYRGWHQLTAAAAILLAVA
jgi:hypothetical protein